MGKRHQARELALKVLFQLEASDDDPEDVLLYHASEGAATADVTAFAGQLVRGVIANRDKLDAILSEASDNWKLDQMAKVDRIVLRIAVYEITIDRKVPPKASRTLRQRHPGSGRRDGQLSSQPQPTFEELLAGLEQTIGRLAQGTAPLDELVAAHERAARLLAEAEARLESLKARADALSAQLRG